MSETVETLERSGGKHAFAHIKQCIPTCEIILEPCWVFLCVVLAFLSEFVALEQVGMGV